MCQNGRSVIGMSIMSHRFLDKIVAFNIPLFLTSRTIINNHKVPCKVFCVYKVQAKVHIPKINGAAPNYECCSK